MNCEECVDNGRQLWYISHHLEEVLELSDRITVLRKGSKIDTIESSGATKRSLSQMMVGREVILNPFANNRKQEMSFFDMSGVDYSFPKNRPLLQSIQMQIRAGKLSVLQVSKEMASLN
jgi:simple sugar transport system ATP-binding protein